MHEDLLALMIPFAAILAFFGLAALKVWIGHRERLHRLRLQQEERQAELDRQVLGLSDPTYQAHLNVILDRLTAIERRLERLEAAGRDEPLPVQTATPPAPGLMTATAPPPAPSTQVQAADRRQETDIEHNL